MTRHTEERQSGMVASSQPVSDGRLRAPARSRSPPTREKQGESRRHHRERSPSRREKRKHEEDRGDGHGHHRSGRSRHHDSHRRSHRDGERDGEREHKRHSHHRSRQDDGRKRRSHSPSRKSDARDGRRSRDIYDQDSIDSTLARKDMGDHAVVAPPATGGSFTNGIMESMTGRTNSTGTMDCGEMVVDDKAEDDNDEDEDEDDYGPSLPPALQHAETTPKSTGTATRPGPAIPSLEDLELRRELQTEAEEDRIASIRLARRADRAIQKERVEELAPRAEPGSHERKLEKKQEKTAVMRQFASAREGGEMQEVDEKELIGGGDGVEEYKRMLSNMQRKKTEREVRREDIIRARNAERDERLREYRSREEETVEKLKEMARQRFG